ncbi:MAG: CcmD family protein [Bacteroidetes bacterium]|jgi:uncharacterized membrane protein (DUF106 family)|nr:MAG: CcmD family protein [Bacteroidota bacterium]
MNTIEMADALRENGKIYTVIAVITLIFLSLMIYLYLQDKKIKYLEKKLDELNQK